MIFFYLLVSVMPMTHHPLWGRVVGEVTVIKYVGGACVLYAVLHFLVRRRPPQFFASWQARLFVVFYLLAALSFFTTSLPTDFRFSPFLSYTSFVGLFFITVTVVDSVNRFRWVLLVAIGSVAFAALYVLREWQKFHTVYRNFRPGWVVGDPNYFTVSALVVIPLAFYLLIERRPLWERAFCLGSLIVALLAVMVAASRGGFVGLLAAFAFVIWHSRQRAQNVVLTAMLLIPISLLAPASPIRRFVRPVPGDTEATQNRLVVWAAGLRMIADHPLSGIGLGKFKPSVSEYEESGEDVESVAHNAYIDVAAEMGLPGLLTFLGVLWFSLRSLRQTSRWAAEHGPPVLQQGTLGLQAGLVGSSVSILFVSGQFQKLLWLAVFLSMSSALLKKDLARREAAEEEAEPIQGAAPGESVRPKVRGDFLDILNQR